MEAPVNRIANSSLVTLALDQLAAPLEAVSFDLADYLWQGLALREREFRAALKEYDWSATAGKRVCIFCSADAIIPQWAYMLVAARAAPLAAEVFVGPPKQADAAAFALAAERLDLSPYTDQKVVVKGCTDGREVGPQAYATLTFRLQQVAASVMYGEPCSTVPIYKRPRR